MMEDRVLTDDEARMYASRLAKLMFTTYDRMSKDEDLDDLQEEFDKLEADIAAAQKQVKPIKPVPDISLKDVPEPKKKTDREEFARFVDRTFFDLKSKMIAKGSQYTKGKPVLDAIYEQTKRRIGKDVVTSGNMLRTILMLSDKHQTALLQHGTAAGDVQDRLTDMIVYDLLALYLLSPHGKAFYGVPTNVKG